MAIVIDNKFEIGEFVYLITDPEQLQRVITGIVVRPAGVLYYATCCERETGHYGFELTKEKNILTTTTD